MDVKYRVIEQPAPKTVSFGDVKVGEYFTNPTTDKLYKKVSIVNAIRLDTMALTTWQLHQHATMSNKSATVDYQTSGAPVSFQNLDVGDHFMYHGEMHRKVTETHALQYSDITLSPCDMGLRVTRVIADFVEVVVS